MPALHWLQTASLALLHVTWLLGQPLTAGQLVQVVSVVPLQPPPAYWPLAHDEQLAHVSATPLTRYLLAPQVVHCESAALVQVSAEVQPATAVQATQAPLDRKNPLLHWVQTASLPLVQVV